MFGLAPFAIEKKAKGPQNGPKDSGRPKGPQSALQELQGGV